jgi:MoaA/NifB/PqqE/SkfB family radical SAM enzyme
VAVAVASDHNCYWSSPMSKANAESKTFCAFPFQHLCLGSEGTARLCCMSHDLVTDHGAPMSLSGHTMDEIWNSAYMRSLRRGMLNGEHISSCEVCYESEAASGQSYRTNSGLQPIEGHPVSQAEMQRSYGSSSNFRVSESPIYIKLETGNLCNLKCRMCWDVNSSQIERDPVHSKWNGRIDPLHGVWRGNTARIGPEPHIGVRTSGLYPLEYLESGQRCWTDGHATFNVPLKPGTRLAALDISFHSEGIRGQHYQIAINGRQTTRGILSVDGPTAITIDLNDFSGASELSIEVASNRIVEQAGEPERGLPLHSLVLRREMAEVADELMFRQTLLSDVAIDGPWYMDDHKLFDDVFKSVDTLQRLYITGGEPLINERVTQILDHLVRRGAARRIHLELSTNCTHIDERIIKTLEKFRKVDLYLSLEAVGDYFEYIRYPAHWHVIDANVRKLNSYPKLKCSVSPVVQTYNVLNLVDLYRYCDTLGMHVTLNILHMPERLAIRNLPPSVRRVAARRLFDYHESDCLEEHKAPVLSLARYLDQALPVDPKMIREFMLFTNDLDATRRQSFRTTHAEFVELLAQDGFAWTDEVRHAKSEIRSRPARERVFAYL